MAATARARAYWKYHSVATTIRELCENQPKGIGLFRTCAMNTKRWLSTMKFDRVPPPKDQAKGLLVVGELAWKAQARGKLYQRQGTFHYTETVGYLKQALRVPHLARGTRDLCAFRMGGFVTAKKLATLNQLPAKYTKVCPFCEVKEPESETHLLTRCLAWAEQRKLIQHMIDWGNGHMCNVIGGRMLMTGIDEAFMAEHWLEGPNQESPCGWKQTAKFFQQVDKERTPLIKQLRSDYASR